MKEFTTLKGIVVPLNAQNVDTDQIIPSDYLKRIERTGYEDGLFSDLRYLEDGSPNPDFALNQDRYQGGCILLTRDNFGCGSSREHAPWALDNYGFRCILAPSFADIFYNNCFNNGMLPIVLPGEVISQLFAAVEANGGYELDVNLSEQTVTKPDGSALTFEIDAALKERLLNGWDQIGLTLRFEDEIDAYETKTASVPR